MFDEKYHDRTDRFGTRMARLGEQMTPTPQLMKAAASGTPLQNGICYSAGTHVKQTAKAILLYVACIALFLGAVMLLPRWLDTQPPVGTEPTDAPRQTTTTPAVTTAPIVKPGIEVDPLVKRHSLTFDNGSAFEAFAREFFGVNPVSVVIPVGLDSETVIARYVFDGDYHAENMMPQGYAFESGEKYFHMAVFGFENAIDEAHRNDHFNDEELHRDCDYAVYLESYVNCIPVTSRDSLRVAEVVGDGDLSQCIHGDQLTDYVAWEWDAHSMRRYDVMDGDTVWLSFVTRVNSDGGDALHHQLCEWVMEHLVSFVTTAPSATGEHQFWQHSTGQNSCTTDTVTTYRCEVCNYTYTETIPATEHEFVNGDCLNCSAYDPDYGSPGLEYEAIIPQYGSISYKIVGIGTCTDSHLIIPKYYDGKAVVRIDEKAFAGIEFIESVTVSTYLHEIGDRAFENCPSLRTVTLCDNIEKVGDYVFANCPKLYSVRIDVDIKEIGLGMFYQCRELTRIFYGKSEFVWEGIGKGTEWNTGTGDYIIRFGESSLVTVNGSHGLEYGQTQEGYAVVGIGTCTDATVIVPSECNGLPLNAIGDGAFAQCTEIEQIEIPDTVRKIGGEIFSGCHGLSRIVFQGTQEQWESIEKDPLWDKNLPDGIVIEYTK